MVDYPSGDNWFLYRLGVEPSQVGPGVDSVYDTFPNVLAVEYDRRQRALFVQLGI